MATVVMGSSNSSGRLLNYVRTGSRSKRSINDDVLIGEVVAGELSAAEMSLANEPQDVVPRTGVDEVDQVRNLRLSGVHCDPWTAEQTFAAGRRKYGARGREAIHIIQSYAVSEANPDNPDDVDAVELVARDLVTEMYPGQPAVVAVQADGKGGKLHVHIVLDPVARHDMSITSPDGSVTRLKAGSKLARGFTDIATVRAAADEKVRAHGIEQSLADYREVRDSPNRALAGIQEHRAAVQGKQTSYQRIQEVFVAGVQDPAVVDRETMVAYLKEHDVEVNHRVGGKRGETWTYKDLQAGETKGPVRYVGAKKLGRYFALSRFDELMTDKQAGRVLALPDATQHADQAPKPIPRMTQVEIKQAEAVIQDLVDQRAETVAAEARQRADEARRVPARFRRARARARKDVAAQAQTLEQAQAQTLEQAQAQAQTQVFEGTGLDPEQADRVDELFHQGRMDEAEALLEEHVGAVDPATVEVLAQEHDRVEEVDAQEVDLAQEHERVQRALEVDAQVIAVWDEAHARNQELDARVAWERRAKAATEQLMQKHLSTKARAEQLAEQWYSSDRLPSQERAKASEQAMKDHLSKVWKARVTMILNDEKSGYLTPEAAAAKRAKVDPSWARRQQQKDQIKQVAKQVERERSRAVEHDGPDL